MIVPLQPCHVKDAEPLFVGIRALHDTFRDLGGASSGDFRVGVRATDDENLAASYGMTGMAIDRILGVVRHADPMESWEC